MLFKGYRSPIFQVPEIQSWQTHDTIQRLGRFIIYEVEVGVSIYAKFVVNVANHLKKAFMMVHKNVKKKFEKKEFEKIICPLREAS